MANKLVAMEQHEMPSAIERQLPTSFCKPACRLSTSKRPPTNAESRMNVSEPSPVAGLLPANICERDLRMTERRRKSSVHIWLQRLRAWIQLRPHDRLTGLPWCGFRAISHRFHRINGHLHTRRRGATSIGLLRGVACNPLLPASDGCL